MIVAAEAVGAGRAESPRDVGGSADDGGDRFRDGATKTDKSNGSIDRAQSEPEREISSSGNAGGIAALDRETNVPCVLEVGDDSAAADGQWSAVNQDEGLEALLCMAKDLPFAAEGTICAPAESGTCSESSRPQRPENSAAVSMPSNSSHRSAVKWRHDSPIDFINRQSSARELRWDQLARLPEIVAGASLGGETPNFSDGWTAVETVWREASTQVFRGAAIECLPPCNDQRSGSDFNEESAPDSITGIVMPKGKVCCECDSCEGSRVISIKEFGRHAGHSDDDPVSKVCSSLTLTHMDAVPLGLCLLTVLTDPSAAARQSRRKRPREAAQVEQQFVYGKVCQGYRRETDLDDDDSDDMLPNRRCKQVKAATAKVGSSGGTYAEAALAILREERRLMRPGEIAALAVAQGLLGASSSKTPSNSMSSHIYTNISKNPNSCVYVRYADGFVGLREWETAS